MRTVPIVLVASLLLRPISAVGQCDSVDASQRQLVTIGHILSQIEKRAYLGRDQINAAMAFRTLEHLNSTQLGFLDLEHVRVKDSVIPKANTAGIWELMSEDKTLGARDRGLIDHPSKLPRGDRGAGLRALGFEPKRDLNDVWVKGDAYIGGHGQAVIVNRGNFGMRVITYDGYDVSYAEVNLYEDVNTREKRYEVTNRVDLTFPPDTPRPMTHF